MLYNTIVTSPFIALVDQVKCGLKQANSKASLYVPSLWCIRYLGVYKI